MQIRSAPHVRTQSIFFNALDDVDSQPVEPSAFIIVVRPH